MGLTEYLLNHVLMSVASTLGDGIEHLVVMAADPEEEEEEEEGPGPFENVLPIGQNDYSNFLIIFLSIFVVAMVSVVPLFLAGWTAPLALFAWLFMLIISM